ncbi:hypothetical protein FB451DRAFT_1266216 [Mycena latifolia]|nr:hypothetical protein FB451DRAFT_1266216 [Mycena latifolia]
MAADPTHPSLPLELERKIFELSALSRPVSIPKLLRVAWRVKHWVEPLLYQTLIIDAKPIDGLPACSMETFKRIVRTKSASFLRHCVRNLMLPMSKVPDHEIQLILSTCSGVHNLFAILLGIRENKPTSMATMSLRHLHCNLEDLAGVLQFGSLSHPAFSRLTHLDLDGLIDNGMDSSIWAHVAGLAHLTHLALDDDCLGICAHLLDTCKSLHALILLPAGATPPADSEMPTDDLRLVIVVSGPNFVKDWQRGILTGDDYWSRADAFIAKRRAGEIDRRTFILTDDR